MNKSKYNEHDHNQAVAVTADSERRVFWAMLLTGSFMLAEVVGGLLSGSLALLADAGHMLSDFVAMALAWVAFRVGRKSPDLRRSYGYHRFQVLAAFVNGLTLIVIAAWILVTAIARLFAPVDVLAGPMLVIAAIGLLVNIAAFAILKSGDRENLNLKGAALHVLGDLLSSVAAIVAAVIILLTGWMQADPILSLFAGLLIVRVACSVVRLSGHILLEGTPELVDPQQVKISLTTRIPEVLDVHHVHIWSLTSERPVLTLHALVREDADHDQVMNSIHKALKSLFGVAHATVQLEYGACVDELKQPETV
ncbi:MAG: cation diffusion facilitator family transporter [Gammaproteobacteria bacterium]|nr:cation diffusion facilitator family transporter [Gammaproteobacteria bacterium]